MTTTGDVLSRAQALERYMQKHGQELLEFYQQANDKVVSRVQVYVDPEVGRLRADVVLNNGLYLPFIVEIDPDWETNPPLQGLGALINEVNTAITDAAAERKNWES